MKVIEEDLNRIFMEIDGLQANCSPSFYKTA